MTLRLWPTVNRERAAWGAVLVAAVLAASVHWLEDWRPASPDRLASFTFTVTSSQDGGPGSLREAILAADRAPKRARITIAVPRISLTTGLPPLVNPEGVVIESPAGTEIDGTQLTGPVVDIAAPGSLVSGLQLTRGGAGIVVRAAGVTIRSLSIRGSETGVLIGEGSDDVRIEASAFTSNGIGVHVVAPEGRTLLHNGHFTAQRLAAIWAVAAVAPSPSAPQIHIADSEFLEDAMGLVAINVASRLERNAFQHQRSAAVHASGGRTFIVGNRIQSGRGFGIYAERLQSGHISGNEIARNCSGGMMLRDVGNTEVLANEVYQNGYGLVVMEGPLVSPNNVTNNLIADQIGDGLLLIGASPIVSRNQILRNRKAGLRFSSLRGQSGSTRTSRPLLTDNIVRQNGRDDTQVDQFANDPPAASAQASDCSWRLGPPVIPTTLQARTQ